MMRGVTVIVLCIAVSAVFGNGPDGRDTHEDIKAFPFDTPYLKNGLPLPLPTTWTHTDKVFAVRSDGFVFNATGHTCDDLEAAFDRYYKMIFDTPNSVSHELWLNFFFYRLVSVLSE